MNDLETISRNNEDVLVEPQLLQNVQNVHNEVENFNDAGMIELYNLSNVQGVNQEASQNISINENRDVKDGEFVDEQMLAIIMPAILNKNLSELVTRVDNKECTNFSPIPSLMNVQDNGLEGRMEEGEFVLCSNPMEEFPW
ncbi:hypothetical protein IEQ34_003020 [Dendrobium chrysotoxum]|uniref:Uncharacterized protein n=1 Tax=Dendrobium chrysotoxum TaxID=161865 RepID=A0AAV7HJH6_DENCH|nr:hypothetical protein IEQ34_003020 [Dendrobium chrysotoxum]